MKTKKIEALWSHVHWLGVLAALGSFSAAAQRLGVSKAAMSHRIGELEAAAGVPLVRRTTRSMQLTDAGARLVDATRASFTEIERSFADIKDLAASPSGVLRVTAPVALGRQRIVPLIPAFLKSHPEVRIELALSDRLASLTQEGFDLAIRHVAAVPDTHVAWTLCATQSVLVATRAYLRRCGTPAQPSELAQHNCLHYLRSGSPASWSFQPAPGAADNGGKVAGKPIGRGAPSGGGERLSVPISGNFSANNSEALREAALGGLGIALLPDFSAERDLAAGKLQRVLGRWRPVGAFGDQLFAIRPYSPHVPRAVAVFVAHLREQLKGGFVEG